MNRYIIKTANMNSYSEYKTLMSVFGVNNRCIVPGCGFVIINDSIPYMGPYKILNTLNYHMINVHMHQSVTLRNTNVHGLQIITKSDEEEFCVLRIDELNKICLHILFMGSNINWNDMVLKYGKNCYTYTFTNYVVGADSNERIKLIRPTEDGYHQMVDYLFSEHYWCPVCKINFDGFPPLDTFVNHVTLCLTNTN